MESLIKRLEELKGPDRQLGEEILLACGWKKARVGYFYGPIYIWASPKGQSYSEDHFPDPTASLDAAITLVPEGWSYILTEDKTPDTDGICEAKLSGSMWSDEKKSKARAKTLPIALCIAALKARQGGKGE